MATEHTNVVALIDSKMQHRFDEMMNDRDSAYKLYAWYLKSGRENKQISQELVGFLINEVFSQRKQLEKRHERGRN